MRSARIPLLVFLLVATARSAFAQQPVVVYPPSCEPSKVSKSDIERAHTVFLSGKQYLDESNYDKAISYFVDAYSIDCSVHGILPIIATAYERKGDRAAALRALAEYQQRSPGAADHDVVERRIKNLKDQLAKEQPPAVEPSPPVPIPAAVTTAPPAAGAPSSEVAVAAPPSASPVSGAPPTVEGKSSHLGPWILAVAGGATLVTGAVMLGVGAGDVSTAESRCPSRTNCSKADATQGNRGRTLEGVGVAAGALGASAIVGGLVWLATQPSRGSPPTTGWLAAPMVAPGYAGASFARVF